MSKRCPDCGFVNDDSRIYCGSCGEPLDAELRLMKDLNKQAGGPKKTGKDAPARQDPASRAFRSDFDEDDVPHRRVQEKKSSPIPWIILGLIVVGVAVWLLMK